MQSNAAKAAGVKRIVYLPFYGASPDTAFTFGQDQDSRPGGRGRCAPVARDDVADAIGRGITHVDETIEEAWA